jgi:hypothetical protein
MKSRGVKSIMRSMMDKFHESMDAMSFIVGMMDNFHEFKGCNVLHRMYV